MARRQWGSVSRRPSPGSTRSASWCSQPALVLLGTVVVVDAEEHAEVASAAARGRGGLPAPRADLDEDRPALGEGLAGPLGGGEQGEAFIFGHEARVALAISMTSRTRWSTDDGLGTVVTLDRSRRGQSVDAVGTDPEQHDACHPAQHAERQDRQQSATPVGADGSQRHECRRRPDEHREPLW